MLVDIQSRGTAFDQGAVLFNPFYIRWKDRGDTNQTWWITYQDLFDMLKADDWWSICIAVALPRKTLGQLDIVQNKYIRPWSLAPEWQLHRGFSVRDAKGKLIGISDKTFDTAVDLDHMLLVAEQRLNEVLIGSDVFC